MKGFVQDIEGIAVRNDEFRRVLYTARNCQLVVMALKPKEEIGMEVHKLDQFFRVEEGTGEAVLDGAFMLDYGLKRADYIEAFFKNIDWKAVESRLK